MIAMHTDTVMSANMPDHSLFLQLPCHAAAVSSNEWKNPPRMPLPNRPYTDNGDTQLGYPKPKSWRNQFLRTHSLVQLPSIP